MMSVIKTAIITIIISFISGVLLDYYKNYAPRIVCTLVRIKSKTYSSRNIKVYSIIVKNISNKTLHNININVQGEFDNLKIEYARITKGLKYDISHERRDYDVAIPFLSKDDEFKAKILVPVESNGASKPVITLRSPENFKEIGSCKDENPVSGFLNSLFNNKKTIISIVSILIVVYIGILGGEYYLKTASAKINSDNAGKTGEVQKITPVPKEESKVKSSESKPSSVAKNNKPNGTKKLESNQTLKNNTSNTDNKNSESSKKQNTENQKGENNGSKDIGNSENKKISTEENIQKAGSTENKPQVQSKSGSQSSGSDNNQNSGINDKLAESNNK